MKSLFIASISEYAGKNLVALGIARKLISQGKKVGYFRPIGIFPIEIDGVLTCEDCVFFKKVLGLTDPLSIICPIVITRELIDQAYGQKINGLKEKIVSAFNEISKDKDIVVISGLGNLSHGNFLNLNEVELIKIFSSKVLLVDKCSGQEHESVDAFIQAKEILKENLFSVMFNRVPKARLDYFKAKVIPYLEKKGIGCLGLIPEDPILGSVSVEDLTEVLSGKALSAKDKLNTMVEKFMIGAMNVESALKFFRQTPNKAVITGGDRSDIQLAALETSTKCLILTGDLYPSHNILVQAEEKNVPVIVVPYDTLTTVDRIETLLGHLSIRSESKVQRICEVVEKYLDFEKVYSL
jgi:BioD-like phosphotransacetylase family protein